MLSIEITDRKIKLVRGVYGGNKIRVFEVGTRDLATEQVVNGYIVDIPLVAAEINDILKQSGVKEKEAKVCITSSSVVHKEILLPKPKKLKNNNALEGMIRNNLGVSSEYNISYTIAGETQDEEKNPLIKIIASACPQRLVDGYKRLFTHLGLSLKEINLSNNSITRLIINTAKMVQRMPLLLVQVDPDFISVNLFEEQQVVFSSFFKISKSDYDGAEDYINKAVYDKLFLLLQFIKSRKNARPLKEILFYGEIPDFISLSNAVASFDIPSHVLSIPSNVVAMCELDFTKYANAIGAIYKVNRDLERINLLETTAIKESSGDAAFFVRVGLFALLTAGVVFGSYGALNFFDNSIKEATTIAEAEIEKLKPDLEIVDARLAMLSGYQSNAEMMKSATILYNFMPKLISDIEKRLEAPFAEINKGTQKISLTKLSLTDYTVTAEYQITGSIDPTEVPSRYVEMLTQIMNNRNIPYFDNIVYTGFEKKDADQQDGNDPKSVPVTFTLQMMVRPGNDEEHAKLDMLEVVPVATEAATTTPNAETSAPQ